jgi:phage recombination protein Bet
MEPAAFEQTLRATVVPMNCTREQFAAFLMVARDYNLNPVTREIFAMTRPGGGVQPIVGVDGWMKLINSHEQMDGMEFEDVRANGDLIAIKCRIYRKDRAHPIEVTEYMSECKRATDPWRQWPIRMLRHKAVSQAARYAFSFTGIMDMDEYERWKESRSMSRTAIKTLEPVANGKSEEAPQERMKRQTKKELADQLKASLAETENETIDNDTGEIVGGIDIAAIADKMIAEVQACNDVDAFAEWQNATIVTYENLPGPERARVDQASRKRYQELL